MLRVVRRIVTAWLVVVTLSSVFVVVSPAAAGSTGEPTRSFGPVSGSVGEPQMPAIDPAILEFMNRRPTTPEYEGKMSPAVREAASRADGTMRVVVATDDVGQLGRLLRAAGVDTLIGSVPSSRPGLRAVVVEVPTNLLGKIAALDRVIEVAPAIQLDPPVAVDPDVPSLPGEGPAPSLIEAGKGHHVPDAWALGYTGVGMRVAPMDSGTDFGHPDLQGTFARVTDPSSPYIHPFFGLGWPMAFDPYSMEVYIFAGGATFPAATFSWYVDTSFTTTADPMSGLITTPFMGRVYNVSGIPSASGVYHIGLHPDRTLRFSSAWNYRAYVGMLVTDPFFPGLYDTVFVDLDHDLRFWDDKPAHVFSPEIWADYYDASTSTWDNSSYSTGDGIADMSGGMVYFIADGVNPIPYSDNIWDTYEFPGPVPVPGSGNLVALQIGDTGTAGGGDHGTFVASSIVAQNVTGAVQGFAPDARLISVGNVYASSILFYDMWRFVAQGYDGIPLTGDEAHVASASFGFSGTFNDGFDFASRWADYHAFNNTYTTYVVSSGNGGHGFGTVTSPGTGSFMVTVGASTSYFGGTPFPVGASDPAAHNTFGDVQPWSNRGPSTLGQNKPDVVTVGAWATGNGALNSFGGRTSPWLVWGGTSLSAPATAAVLALIREAFEDTFGGPQEGFLAKAMLMAGADNIHYDGLVMGAGLTNAARSVGIASAVDGIVPLQFSPSVPPLPPIPSSSWTAGDFRGVVYPGFPRIMYPGTNNTTLVGLYNPTPFPKDVTISDWQLEKTGSSTFTVLATNTAESAPSFTRPDYLIDLTPFVPPGTALLKATVTFPFSQFDPDGNYAFNSRWRVLLYDWKDYDGNGTAWTDTNSNGVVNSGELDLSMGLELQRFAYGYPSHTNIQAYVHDPLSRINDGLLLGIQHRTVSASVLSTTLTVTVDYYAAVDAPWLAPFTTSLTVPCCAPSDFAILPLVVDIPLGTQPGILSGFVTVSNLTSGDVQIPVTVNVARTGPSFTFGGVAGGTAFYDNSRVFGGADWAWRAESGDWRFYWADIPDSTPVASGDRLLVHTMWENVPTDLDTFILGPGPDDCFIYDAPCFSPSPLFGPYSMNIVGQSSQLYLGSGRYRFNTATGGAEEWVSAPLSTGLHGIALHNVLFAGLGPSEVLSGSVGTFSASPTPWFESTPNGTGIEPFTVSSSLPLPGLDVRAYGLARPINTTRNPILHQQDLTLPSFTATSAGLLEAWIDDSLGIPGTDLDLYLERLVGTTWTPVASGTTPAAFERVRVLFPSDGVYRLRVVGFAIPGGSGYFDFYRVVIQGTELTPSGVETDPIPAGTPTSFNVSWDTNRAPGPYVGILFVGPEGAPTTVEIPIAFVLVDARPPVILSVDPADGSYLSDKTPTITTTYMDERISGGILFAFLGIDGLFLPAVGGFNNTTAVFTFPFALDEGSHLLNLTLLDGGGFLSFLEWTITIDSFAPSLEVTSPAYALTRVASATVAGTTEPGVGVTVNGVPASVSGAGAFSTSVALAEGPNTIVVVATDAAGNTASVTKSVTLDTVAPALTIASPAGGALLASRSVTVSGTLEVGASLTVNGLAVVASSGSWSVDLAFEDGPHTITAVATDAVGNTATIVRSITVDTVSPSLTVASPDYTLTRNPAAVVAGSTDPTATVTVNGAPVAVNPTTGAFSTTLTLTEGLNSITVVASDAVGNSVSVTRWVTLDTAAPGLTIASPTNGAIFRTSVVAVSGTAEAGSEVTVNGLRVAVSATGAWSVEVALADGSRTITVLATDAAGNTAQDSRTITVDTVAPGVSSSASGILGQNGWYTSDVTVTLAASDPTPSSGVDRIEYRFNGTGSWMPVSGGTAVVTISDGTTVIEYRAVDEAGNVGVERSLTVRVDTAAPLLTVTAPAQGAGVENSTVEVTGIVDDATAVVLVNGEEVRPDGTGTWRTTVALVEGSNTITIRAVDAAGNAATTVTRVVVYTSPLPEIQDQIVDNSQAISGVGNSLSFGLIAVLVVLVALQLILYRNLNKKLEAVRKGEMPPPPPEMP